jgi:hypothetical protein
MATPHTQPSPVHSPLPRMAPRDPEPSSRLAQDAVQYKGPSRHDYRGRMRLMYTILGLVIVVCAGAVIRVLTHGGL